MTCDPRDTLGAPDYFGLQHDYDARGFEGVSYEMNMMRNGQSWRLMQGAEPSHWLSYDTAPASFMRYGPYK